MREQNIRRARFLRDGSWLAVAAAPGLACETRARRAAPACTGPCCGKHPIAIRRCSLMCLVCALDPHDKPPYSVWRDACGALPPANDVKGRQLLLARFK